MADKTFTVEQLSQLLIQLMNQSKSEIKQIEVEDKNTKETKNDNENKGEYLIKSKIKFLKKRKKIKMTTLKLKQRKK